MKFLKLFFDLLAFTLVVIAFVQAVYLHHYDHATLDLTVVILYRLHRNEVK